MKLEGWSRMSFLYKYNLLIIAILTIITIASVLAISDWHYKNTLQMAMLEANTHIELTLNYRSVIAKFGGVYAPVDKAVPNPYLEHPRKFITTSDGQRLTLINPAYLTRLVFETINIKAGSLVIDRITSLKPFNPSNAPDEWEKKALFEFNKGTKEISGIFSINDKPFFRLMRPFIAEKGCLSCHGVQGYKEGDIRGGISVSIPLESYFLANAQFKKKIYIIHGLLWLFTSCFLFAAGIRREKSVHALQISEEKYRTLVDSMSEGLGIQDEKGFITYMNKAACKMFGYELSELVGKPVNSLFDEENLQIFNKQMEARRKGEDHSYQVAWKRKDGSKVYTIVSPRVFLDKKGNYKGSFGVFTDITDIKQNEISIQDRYRFRQAIIENAADGICVCRDISEYPFVEFTLWNRQMEVITGYTLEEINRHGWYQSMYPDPELQKRAVERMSRMRKGENLVSEEWMITRRNGEKRDVSISTSIVEDAESAYVLAVVSDITERKNNEIEIIKGKERVQALLELNNIAHRSEQEIADYALEAVVKLSSSKGGYLHFINLDEKTLSLYSWSKEVTKICTAQKEPHYPIDKAGIWCDPVRLRKPVIHNDYQNCEGKKGLPEGHFPVYRHMSIPVFDGDKIVAVAGVGNKEQPYTDEDVNNLYVFFNEMWKIIKDKRAQHAIITSEIKYRKLSNKFDALLDANPDVVLLISSDMNISWANSSAARMMGKIQDEIIGQTCYSLLHGSNLICDFCPALKSFKTGQTVSEYITLPSGLVWEVRTVPIKDEGGSVVSVLEVIRDITDNRKLEEQLRQLQKMEAVGTLAGGVAHDFNNILTAIVGYAQLALMKMHGDDPQRYNLEQIIESSNRATTLTHSLLSFSRKQPVNLQVLDLNSLIMNFEKFLRRLIKEDIELRTAYAKEPLFIFADRGQIEQVIMNLITNARDAMPQGGVITVQTARIVIDDDYISSHGYGKHGEYAVLSILDTGTGMDGETREKIFEPFFTTKETGKGTGLGLSMVYGIVKKHEGYIDVHSEQGKGSSFKVYLPTTTGNTLPEVDKVEASGAHHGSETIMIAEDDVSVRQLYSTILGEHGYNVIQAKDGDEAVKKFTENKKDICLAIIDGIMPKKNGMRVFEEIRLLNPAVKVIFMSGYSEDIFSINDKGLNERTAFILKPSSPTAVLQKIRELLNE